MVFVPESYLDKFQVLSLVIHFVPYWHLGRTEPQITGLKFCGN